jgi:hypothetical protein
MRFWRGRYSPLDSSDDGLVGRAHRGYGHKFVFAPQTIDQSPFPWAQHLLGQRGEVPENPQQICALSEAGLNISRPDQRINLQNAAGEFFNPHTLACLDDTVEIAESGSLLHRMYGNGKKSFAGMPTRVAEPNDY